MKFIKFSFNFLLLGFVATKPAIAQHSEAELQIIYKRAMTEFQSRHYSDCLEDFKVLLAEDRHSPKYLIPAASAAFSIDDFSSAKKYINELLTDDGEDFELFRRTPQHYGPILTMKREIDKRDSFEEGRTLRFSISTGLGGFDQLAINNSSKRSTLNNKSIDATDTSAALGIGIASLQAQIELWPYYTRSIGFGFFASGSAGINPFSFLTSTSTPVDVGQVTGTSSNVNFTSGYSYSFGVEAFLGSSKFPIALMGSYQIGLINATYTNRFTLSETNFGSDGTSYSNDETNDTAVVNYKYSQVSAGLILYLDHLHGSGLRAQLLLNSPEFSAANFTGYELGYWKDYLGQASITVIPNYPSAGHAKFNSVNETGLFVSAKISKTFDFFTNR